MLTRCKTTPMAPNRISGIEEIVLRLLIGNAARPMYGLELVKTSDGELKRGTVYVTLQRMEDKGLVESREEDETADHIGLRRRLYKVTGHGQRAYQAHRAAEEAAARIMALPEGALS